MPDRKDIRKEVDGKINLLISALQEIEEERKKPTQETYYDLVLKEPNPVSTFTIAHDYGMTVEKMNETLENLEIQFKWDDSWFLTTEFQGKGYGFIKESSFFNFHIDWTQKGRLLLYERLKNKGKLPLIELNFNDEQIELIHRGLSTHLDIRYYAKPEFTPKQMKEIIQGLERGLKVSIYANPRLNWKTMRQLRWLLEKIS